jgi:Flp pilus assembly protein, pilin Flp
MKQIIKFLKEEDGATAIEYGLIAGLIAVAIIATLTTLGTDLNAMFQKIVNALEKPAST